MGAMNLIIVLALLIGANCCACEKNDATVPQPQSVSPRQNVQIGSSQPTLMKTNIALVNGNPALTKVRNLENVVIDPSTLLDKAGILSNAEIDIEEDPNDKFITTRSGKSRPKFETGTDEWSEDTKPAATAPKVLSRVKRCRRNNDDDDDAMSESVRARRARRRRARRARRTRRARRAKARRNANKSTTTTITRQVIQNGQVVSQTVEQKGQPVQLGAQPVVPPVQPVLPVQPVIIQQQPLGAQQRQQPAVAQSPPLPQHQQQIEPQQAQQSHRQAGAQASPNAQLTASLSAKGSASVKA